MESRPLLEVLMSVPATCPFCNALLSATAVTPEGRVSCPRCGETVATGAKMVAPARHQADDLAARRDKSSRSVRRLTVAVLVVLTVVAGGWALWANWHRVRTPFGSPAPPAKPAVVKPADMPGLGYLPASTDAILAVQVPLLLERLGPDAQAEPMRALTALGLPEAGAEIIDKASAIGLKNVDHLVIGLGFEKGSLPPQLFVVVHALAPFDLKAVARHANAHPQKKDGRTLYSGKAGNLPVELHWWQAADRVLVATISPRDFEGVPLARSGLDQLPPAVANLIRDRLAEDACAWLVAASDKWDRHLAPYTLPFVPGPFQGRTDLLKPAERLRTVALSVPFDPDHPVDVQIGLKSAAAGEELRAALSERFHGESVEVSGAEEVVRVQVKNDPTNIRSIFSRLTIPGGK
jgi:hypothetical protein